METTAPPFEPRIGRYPADSPDPSPFYWDGSVLGAVNEFELPDGRRGIVIHEWSSHDTGRGNTVRALKWLRPQFEVIAANGVGSIDEYDGAAVPDPTILYWEHLRSKGLVDTLVLDSGVELPPGWQDATLEPAAGPR